MKPLGKHDRNQREFTVAAVVAAIRLEMNSARQPTKVKTIAYPHIRLAMKSDEHLKKYAKASTMEFGWTKAFEKTWKTSKGQQMQNCMM